MFGDTRLDIVRMLYNLKRYITSILCSVLQESGFEVTSFEDPVLALKHFKPRYYDLEILDIYKFMIIIMIKLYKLLLSKEHLQNEVAIEIIPAAMFKWDYEKRMMDI
jgi:hypothetical protein